MAKPGYKLRILLFSFFLVLMNFVPEKMLSRKCKVGCEDLCFDCVLGVWGRGGGSKCWKFMSKLEVMGQGICALYFFFFFLTF